MGIVGVSVTFTINSNTGASVPSFGISVVGKEVVVDVEDVVEEIDDDDVISVVDSIGVSVVCTVVSGEFSSVCVVCVVSATVVCSVVVVVLVVVEVVVVDVVSGFGGIVEMRTQPSGGVIGDHISGNLNKVSQK